MNSFIARAEMSARRQMSSDCALVPARGMNAITYNPSSAQRVQLFLEQQTGLESIEPCYSDSYLRAVLALPQRLQATRDGNVSSLNVDDPSLSVEQRLKAVPDLSRRLIDGYAGELLAGNMLLYHPSVAMRRASSSFCSPFPYVVGLLVFLG